MPSRLSRAPRAERKGFRHALRKRDGSFIALIQSQAKLAKSDYEREELEKRAAADVPSAHLRDLQQRVIEETDAAIHRQIDSILEELDNCVVIEFLEETSPGSQIVAYAEAAKCDLIVMGSRGLGAIRGMLGSVSNHVLREASMPVLVVKAAE